MRIKNSLEWSTYEATLLRQANRITIWENKIQCRQLIQNIGKMVNDLSRAEVESRRTRSGRSDELLEQINKDIESVEDFILMGTLLG